MKVYAFIVAVALLAWLGWHWATPAPSLSNQIHQMDPSERAALPPPTQTLTDPTAVFERAFWKHPGTNDRILHAERREWVAGGGVKQWQWFLAVQPSPELVRYLRDDNAFNLTPTTTSIVSSGAPEWFDFKTTEVDVLQSPLGGMALAFSKASNVLYATDSGNGFRPGVPEAPPAPLVQTALSGRLPTTSPPKP